MLVYISPTRGSTPELPPVVSSIRLPCRLTLSGQHSSSVAMTWMAPRLVASHSRFRSADHACESARDSGAGIVGCGAASGGRCCGNNADPPKLHRSEGELAGGQNADTSRVPNLSL